MQRPQCSCLPIFHSADKVGPWEYGSGYSFLISPNSWLIHQRRPLNESLPVGSSEAQEFNVTITVRRASECLTMEPVLSRDSQNIQEKHLCSSFVFN